MAGSRLLLTAAEMQAVDARAAALGADTFMLMLRAGEAVARHVRRRVSRQASIVIIAGPGNNGGDGAIAAASLQASAHSVVLVRLGRDARADSDAARAFAAWSGDTRTVDPGAAGLSVEIETLLEQADLIVDALFGAGLSRPVEGSAAALVKQANESAAQVLAVDLPSGLNGDRHQGEGMVMEAALTVAFERAKPAHYLYPGRAHCGRTFIEPIGMPAAAFRSAPEDCHRLDTGLWRDALPALSPTTHKFQRGHVLVRGGALSQTGAARLSATSALSSGAGLVTLASSREAAPVNAAHLTAVMLKVFDSIDDWQHMLADVRLSAVVIGPGNGVDDVTRAALGAALMSDHTCIIDADALSCHQDDPERFIDSLRSARRLPVLTPHDGEFERLFGHTDIPALPSRLHRARAAARLTRSLVVSKGADTVVAAPDGRAAIGVNAPPWLATAGAGDVLAGLIAGLLAQGMPAFEAASAAVWLHGEAARELGWPLTSESLPGAIMRVLTRVASVAAPVVQKP